MKYWLTALVLAGAMQAQAAIVTKYLPPSDDAEKALRAEIEHSGINKTVADLSAQYFPFDDDLTIEYGSDDGPLYDPDTNTIQMPYGFYAEVKSYFTDNGYSERLGRTAEQGALDTLLHTLLHESAHAYIAGNNIAVLGKEEDAADDFAALMLLNGLDDGSNIAISAADMFAFEADSAERPDYYEAVEYIDEHSFDLQRYFATLCLVYGSDPQTHAGLLDELSAKNRAEREDYCHARYEEATRNWLHYLPQ